MIFSLLLLAACLFSCIQLYKLHAFLLRKPTLRLTGIKSTARGQELNISICIEPVSEHVPVFFVCECVEIQMHLTFIAGKNICSLDE